MNLFSVTLTFFYFAFQVSSIFLQKRKKEKKKKKVVFNFNQLKCLVDYQEGLTFLQMDPCFSKPAFGPTLLNVSFLCVYVSNRNQIGAAIQYLHFELFMFRTRSEENSSGRDKCHCLALLTWLFWKWIWRGTKRACQRLIKRRVVSILLEKSKIYYKAFGLSVLEKV